MTLGQYQVSDFRISVYFLRHGKVHVWVILKPSTKMAELEFHFLSIKTPQ